jgi:chitinase
MRRRSHGVCTSLTFSQGQGVGQLPLKAYCQNTIADVIVVGFINTFPPAANGYVGNNYGNACWDGKIYNYTAPGYNGAKPVPSQNLLISRCPAVQEGIPICQKLGKKIILSIGGDYGKKSYKGQLKSAADGVYFANFLWQAYGPKDPTYNGVRPLDRGVNNNDASITIDADGFDFDIEESIAPSDPNNGKSGARTLSQHVLMVSR